MQDQIKQAQAFLDARTGSVLERNALIASIRTACDKLEYGVPERGSALRLVSKLTAQTRALQADFVDYLLQRTGVKNDRALSFLLELAPPQLSKIRCAIIPVGPVLIVRIHEITGVEIRQIKRMLCLPCANSMVKEETQ